jgi:hypothetical protein
MLQHSPNRHAVTFIFITVFLDMMGFGLIMPVMPALLSELAGLPQMKLGFVQNPPASGAAVAELHASEQCGAERRSTGGMRDSRARTDVKLARDELADYVLGQRDEVVVVCGAPSRHRQGAKVPCAGEGALAPREAGDRPS